MDAEREVTDTETVAIFNPDNHEKCDESGYITLADFLVWVEEAKAQAPEEYREKLELQIRNNIDLDYHVLETDEEMAERLRKVQEEELREKLREESKLTLAESRITVFTDGENVKFFRPYGSVMSLSISELEQAIAHVKTKQPELAAAA